MGHRFSASDFRDRVRRLSAADGSVDGDHTLNPDMQELLAQMKLRDAAVLIPVVDYGDHTRMILTKRTEKLRSHSGQISFPGGRIDATDPTPEFAAMREAEEEIGLTPDYVDVVGRMPDYVSGSGFRIAPILAVVRPGFSLKINEDEVDDAFEVPLGFLMDPANHNRESRIWQNRERYFYTMPFGERYIWGITAGIIRNLYERLYA
ncbi:CoA pyrophosphatase [Aerobium aerolatum]|nr:CoA pyrophosphatase [Aquamicrobium aerolatum]